VGGRESLANARCGKVGASSHTLVRQRQYIGKSQGTSIAGAGLLAHAGAIEDDYLQTSFGKIGGCRYPHDAGTDDGNFRRLIRVR
jgi:hypothetical protein